MPATVLVLQPMDVAAWTDAQLRQVSRVSRSVPQVELGRRLDEGELWGWQEWVLLKRIERLCSAADDGLAQSPQTTTRAWIYDVSSVMGDANQPEALYTLIDLFDLIMGLIETDTWVMNGGTLGGAGAISGHLVIVAPARVHLEIEA